MTLTEGVYSTHLASPNKGEVMEGFELINTGIWSIVPPLLALGLALITKEVYSSLTIGVFVGMVIYVFTLSGPGPEQLIQAFTMVPQMMGEQIANNGALLLFLGLLGALVVVVAIAGGSRAYGEWVTKHVKNAKMAKLLTAILGILIFVDDYFNCLTVGAVMRPVTDHFRVSHEKLAWIIDSTAAPVCIIAPVSSWAVAVGGYLGENGFNTFVSSIPYNFYALITIVFVFFMCCTKFDFGPMKAAEARAAKEGVASSGGRPRNITDPSTAASPARVSSTSSKTGKRLAKKEGIPSTQIAEEADVDELKRSAMQAENVFKGLAVSSKGKVYDLVIPILVLIVFSILGMLYVGGFFEGVDFATAIGVNPVGGLCVGAFVALVVAAAMFLPRGLATLESYMEGVAEGVRSMVSAILILILAWSLGGVCRYMLGTGPFVSEALNNIGIGLQLLPAVIFIVAAFIGFSMGTSWGTIALVLPIVVGIFDPADPLFLVAVGATLGGAVYGDHVSPISDTTILSSAGAECNHLAHVGTQLPYATTVAVVCLIGYIIAGFTTNPWISLVLGLVLMVGAVILLSKVWDPTKKGSAKKQKGDAVSAE